MNASIHARREPTPPLAMGDGTSATAARTHAPRRATVQRLVLVVTMLAMLGLGGVVMVATSPTADQTGQPRQAPPGFLSMELSFVRFSPACKLSR